MMRWKWLAGAIGVLGVQLFCHDAQAQWQNLGGSWTSWDLATSTHVISGGYEIIDLYAVAQSDHSVWLNTINSFNGVVNGWQALGGVVLSTPSAVSWNSHREVFALGTDSALYHNWSDDNATFSGWNYIGHPPSVNLCSAPSAVSWAPGRIDVFVRGCDGNIWHEWTNIGGPYDWEGWENLGGPISTVPSAVSRGSGLLDVLVSDNAGHVKDKSYDAGWTWMNTGITAFYPPTAVLCPVGMAVFAQDRGGTYFSSSEHSHSGSPDWTGTDPAGPSPSASTGLYTPPKPAGVEDFVEVYWKDNGGHIQRQGANCYQWFATNNNLTSGTFISNPAPVDAASLYVFAVNTSGAMWMANDTDF
jgi:hypothetical protein